MNINKLPNEIEVRAYAESLGLKMEDAIFEQRKSDYDETFFSFLINEEFELECWYEDGKVYGEY